MIPLSPRPLAQRNSERKGARRALDTSRALLGRFVTQASKHGCIYIGNTNYSVPSGKLVLIKNTDPWHNETKARSVSERVLQLNSRTNTRAPIGEAVKKVRAHVKGLLWQKGTVILTRGDSLFLTALCTKLWLKELKSLKLAQWKMLSHWFTGRLHSNLNPAQTFTTCMLRDATGIVYRQYQSNVFTWSWQLVHSCLYIWWSTLDCTILEGFPPLPTVILMYEEYVGSLPDQDCDGKAVELGLSLIIQT